MNQAGHIETKMKLSVALVTYNHQPFIEDAIESVLRQAVAGDWEVVIGDDASTDGTRDIIEAFHKRYPDRIRLMTRDINAGDNGRSNYLATLQACRGDYVAYLDGDDYWLGDSKLAKQVNLLDENPNFSGCAHPVQRVYADGSKDNFCAPSGRAPFTLADISRNFTFLHCSSFMYRRSALPDLPHWFADSRVKLDDWALTLLCARCGDIGYVDEILGVYRKHEQGIWSGQQGLKRLSWDITTRNFVHERLDEKSSISKDTGSRFGSAIDKADQDIKAEKSFAARRHLTAALIHFRFQNQLSFTYRIMFLLETWAPFSKPLLIGLRRWLRG